MSPKVKAKSLELDVEIATPHCILHSLQHVPIDVEIATPHCILHYLHIDVEIATPHCILHYLQHVPSFIIEPVFAFLYNI